MPGITSSAAAQVVDNGTAAVKGFNQQQMNSISPSNTFKQFCDSEELEAVKDYIRTSKKGGLPSIGYEISNDFIKSVNLDSPYGELINRVSQHAIAIHAL